MACGAPVVAQRGRAGFPRWSIDGVTGRLVPFDADPVTGFPLDADRFARDLAARIAELMANPSLCAQMGAARPQARRRDLRLGGNRRPDRRAVPLIGGVSEVKSPTIGAMSCADHGALVLMHTSG